MGVVIAAMVIPRLMGRGSLLNENAMVGLLGPALIIFLLGLFDDVHSLNARWKFAVQTVAAICCMQAGTEYTIWG